jgi:hypothetical protein
MEWFINKYANEDTQYSFYIPPTIIFNITKYFHTGIDDKHNIRAAKNLRIVSRCFADAIDIQYIRHYISVDFGRTYYNTIMRSNAKLAGKYLIYYAAKSELERMNLRLKSCVSSIYFGRENSSLSQFTSFRDVVDALNYKKSFYENPVSIYYKNICDIIRAGRSYSSVPLKRMWNCVYAVPKYNDNLFDRAHRTAYNKLLQHIICDNYRGTIYARPHLSLEFHSLYPSLYNTNDTNDNTIDNTIDNTNDNTIDTKSLPRHKKMVCLKKESTAKGRAQNKWRQSSIPKFPKNMPSQHKKNCR